MTDLRTRLAHVYWLGGGTGGGKSTIARHLADRFGLRLYDTDRAMGDHSARSSPRETPYLQDFLGCRSCSA
ncbi:shikimate kinase (plasmid) [Kribbella sp. CWNU-51]